MADWRKIWGEISDSERFHSISERARLGYLQAYPKTDRDGRLPWSPKKLRALAFPMTEWTDEEVEEIRDEMISVGLWIPGVDSLGTKLIYVWRFKETQGEPVRRKREQESKFIDPVVLEPHIPTVSLLHPERIPTASLRDTQIRLDKIREEVPKPSPPAKTPRKRASKKKDTSTARYPKHEIIAAFCEAHRDLKITPEKSYGPAGFDWGALEHPEVLNDRESLYDYFLAAIELVRSKNKPVTLANTLQSEVVNSPELANIGREPTDDESRSLTNAFRRRLDWIKEPRKLAIGAGFESADYAEAARIVLEDPWIFKAFARDDTHKEAMAELLARARAAAGQNGGGCDARVDDAPAGVD